MPTKDFNHQSSSSPSSSLHHVTSQTFGSHNFRFTPLHLIIIAVTTVTTVIRLICEAKQQEQEQEQRQKQRQKQKGKGKGKGKSKGGGGGGGIPLIFIRIKVYSNTGQDWTAQDPFANLSLSTPPFTTDFCEITASNREKGKKKN